MNWKLTVIEKISFCKCGVFSKEAIVNLCIIEGISPQSLENILSYSPTILDQIGFQILLEEPGWWDLISEFHKTGGNRLLEGTKSCVHQDPRERTSDPTGD